MMKRALIMFFVVCIAATIGFAQPKNAQFEVPFKMDRNLILISAKINGTEKYDFLFDTGTNGLVLKEEIAEKFHLKENGFAIMKSPNGEMEEKLKKVIIPSVELNGLQLIDNDAVIVKSEIIFSPTAVGIVGLSAFNGYIVTIDYENSKLIFKKGKLKANKNTLKLTASEILETKIKLNEKEVLAHFDCGAPGYIAIPKEWNADYKLKKEAVLMGKGRTPGGEFEVFVSQLDGSITIGKKVLKNPKITLLTGNFPAINFGFEFFRAYKITIDFQNKLMEIKEK